MLGLLGPSEVLQFGGVVCVKTVCRRPSGPLWLVTSAVCRAELSQIPNYHTVNLREIVRSSHTRSVNVNVEIENATCPHCFIFVAEAGEFVT